MAESLITCKQANVKLAPGNMLWLIAIGSSRTECRFGRARQLNEVLYIQANITRHSVWLGDNLFYGSVARQAKVAK